MNITPAWIVSFFWGFFPSLVMKKQKSVSYYFQCSRGREGRAALLSSDFMNHAHVVFVPKMETFPGTAQK